MSKNALSREKIEEIRKKAEQIFAQKNISNKNLSEEEIDVLLNELSVHQIELELQNEELSNLQNELNQVLTKYYDLYENAPVGYVSLNEDLQITEINRTLLNYLQTNKNNVLGKDLSKFVAPDSQDEFYFHYRKAISSFKKQTAEIKIISHLGNEIYFQFDTIAKKLDDKNIILKSTLTDITVKKIVENELKKEKNNYKLLFDTVPVGIFTIDKNNTILSWNKAAEKITGFSQEEMVGNKCCLCDNEKECDFWDDLIRSDCDRVKKIRTKNGELKFLAFHQDFIKDENENVIAGISSFVDITENLKNTESINLLETAINITADAIFVFNLDNFVIEKTNLSAIKNLGFEEKDIKNLTFFDILKIDTPVEELLTLLKSNINQDKSLFFIGSVIKRDGSKYPVEIQIKCFKNDNKDYAVAFAHDITRRLKDQEKINQQQKFLNAIIENMPLGVFAKNPRDGFKFTIWNKKMEEMFALPEDQVLGKTDYDFFNDDVANFYRETDLEVLKSRKPAVFPELYFQTPNAVFIGRAIKVGIFDEDNQPLSILGIVEDITNIKLNEKRLEESEKKFRLLAENAQDIIYKLSIKNDKIKFDYVSPSIQKITGYSPDEIYSDYRLGLYLLTSHNDIVNADKIQDDINHYFLESTIFSVVNKYNKMIWLETRNTVSILDDTLEIEGVARDITHIIRINQFEKNLGHIFQMIAKNENLDKIINKLILTVEEFLEDICCTILVYNKQTNIYVQFNSNTCPVESNFLIDIIEKSEKFATYDNNTLIINNIEHEKIKSISSAQIIADTGENEGMIILYSKAPFNNIDKIIEILNTITNVTRIAIEKSKFIEELIIAKERAEEASRLKSEFLANISHEIRTPLNSIIGFTDLVKDEHIENKRFADYLKGIESASKNLLNLINDILDLSKIEAGKVSIIQKETNIRQIVDDIASIFSSKLIEKNLTLKIDINENLPKYVFIDDIRFRQILLNLVSNAIKFTEKGYVQISLSHSTISENKIDLVLKVSDTGIGIPKEDYEIIFEPFHQRESQNTRRYEGTGLGLAITKKLVLLMGGEIKVESTVGLGSTFIVHFPNLSVSEKSHIETTEIDIDNIIFNNAKILIAEDNPANALVIENYLKKYNLEILFAPDGQKVVELFDQENPDLVLLDLQMPVYDGIEAAKKIKARNKNVPIIAVTALSSKIIPNEVLTLFSDYLTKPLNKKTLISTLVKFLPTQVVKNESNIEFIQTIIDDIKQIEISNDIDLSTLFDGEIYNLWTNAKKYLLINQIKKFGQKLLEFSEKHNITPLKTYAEKLDEHTKIFNIEGIVYLLDKYSTILENLSNKN